MENIFELTNDELKKIADNLRDKINDGLTKDGTEILAIPTYLNEPKGKINNEKVLVLDWGGTNFRAAVVEFKESRPILLESKKIRLSKKETNGFNTNNLLQKMAELISQLKSLDNTVTKIGYCFSYPARSLMNGDAELLRWTKGIDIRDMIGQPVGQLLLEYLNKHKDIDATFTSIKVINDTVACLFAGLTERNKDAYIGLIVGTGTNMAAMMQLNQIKKLNNKENGAIPVNLESGNFNPPFLTVIDNLVDAMSINKGSQRFEKAISGGYLGEIFKTVFSLRKIKHDFDAEDISNIINNPKKYPEDFVTVSNWIYNRSAQLVAASLAGLVLVLKSHNEKTNDIYIAVDGSLFWSNNYCTQVTEKLKELIPEINIEIAPLIEDPNLIGSAFAAISEFKLN